MLDSSPSSLVFGNTWTVFGPLSAEDDKPTAAKLQQKGCPTLLRCGALELTGSR